MKVKIFILFLIVFMVCGCTAEVNLDISKDTVSESVNITAYENIIYSKELLSTSFRNYIPAFAKDLIMDEAPDTPIPGVLYYKKNLTDLGSGYRFNYSYDFDINSYEEARTVKEAFKSYNIEVDDSNNTISISTDSRGLIYFNNYPELEEVIVNITTDYLVEENNADKVLDNTYTWVFDKDSKKSIDMLINTKVMSDSSHTSFLNIKGVLVPIAIIVGITLLVIIFIALRNKINNKI